jgi:L-fuculose-phosphate aldolase
MFSDFAKYGRILFDQGLNNSHSGNMSFRQDFNIFITRHGARLCDITASDIVKVNLSDTNRDKEASVEVKVHRAVYLACPHIHAITHAHAPHAIVLSLNRSEIIPIDSEGLYYLPTIPVLSANETICSDEVASCLPELFKTHKSVMVQGHGVFSVGKTIEEASMYASVTENAAKLVYLKELLSK